MSRRAHYLLISDWQVLNDWVRNINAAFSEAYGIYLVGSCIHKKSYRDVDVRCIMPDKVFDAEFPGAKKYPYARGKLAQMNAAFSIYAHRVTDLPVDFQFQRATEANLEFPSPEHVREALGMKL